MASTVNTYRVELVELVELVESMLTNMSDHVGQVALVGTAMIYMQQSDSCDHKKIKMFHEKLVMMISDKHQTALTTMGSIISTGLFDMGVCNCVMSL
jgi:26S proteasome regulatory subunit N2